MGRTEKGEKASRPVKAMDLEERIRLVRETLERGAEVASAAPAARAWSVREEGPRSDRYLEPALAASPGRGSARGSPGPSLGVFGGRLESSSEVRGCTQKGGFAGAGVALACTYRLYTLQRARKRGNWKLTPQQQRQPLVSDVKSVHGKSWAEIQVKSAAKALHSRVRGAKSPSD